MNTGVLLLRLLLGAYLFVHGLQKIDPRFDGGGLTAETVRLKADGVRGGRLSAAMSALTQIAAGIGLAAGFLTPLAAAGGIGVMVVASSTKLRNGFWAQNDGVEFPLLLCLIAAAMALVGPGRWSVDHAVHLNSNSAESLGALALGLLGGFGALPLLLGHRPTHPDATSIDEKDTTEVSTSDAQPQ